mgnify:CR=1 FL=1
MNINFNTYDFRKGVIGNDEIAYDVGGVNIPCGVLARSPFYSYHTDLDTPSGISWKNFEETLLVLEEMVHIFTYYTYPCFWTEGKERAKIQIIQEKE